MSIHPTAIIDTEAELHESVEVGPFCVIEENVRVDAGCTIMHGVFLTGWTHIGKDCTIHPGAIVGHSPQDVKYSGERAYCRIGAGTTIREHVTIHRGSDPESETVVGDECFLLAGSHIAHNCRLGRNVTLINKVLLAGHVSVEDFVTIGGGAGVHEFVRIGERAMVRGGARVPMDVPPFALTDDAGRIAGVNRVGLRRAGIDGEALLDIRQIYRTLYARAARFSEAVATVAGESHTPAGRRPVAFLTAKSQRGLAGRSRRPSN
ncbi:MAG: acyl-ACP--UDP-N-acetylglucosamine O-acyltransferase [Planctomycetes bacterium]|nr:acyl-ACP--UDP-N-acetylglucosamine O-acyltransferase [Planctomycetota bacterium]